MPLFQAIALIKSLDSEIKNVEFLYNEKVCGNPIILVLQKLEKVVSSGTTFPQLLVFKQDVLADDLVICLTQDCIRLIFDSMTERLKVELNS